MAKVASKQKRIDDIVTMLEKGLETKDILRKVSESCGKSTRTIESEIKAAKEVLFKRNEHKEAIRVEQTTETLKQAINDSLLSDLEIEGILCKIISGNMQVEQMFDGTPVLRDITPNEIANAAKIVFAKRGSNAPTKTAVTNTDGKDIEQTTITMTIPKGLDISFPSNLDEPS